MYCKCFFVYFKILSEALIKCHKTSSEAGTPLQLQVFISGRNRLENPGAKSLAAAFEVRTAFIATGFVTVRLHTSQVAHRAKDYPSFCSMKQLGVFLLPMDGMLVYCIKSFHYAYNRQ